MACYRTTCPQTSYLLLRNRFNTPPPYKNRFLRNTRFFYFHDEAITEENLKTYLHKDSASKSIAAHALHTGKGLWFHCKDETHKVPHGIIKLADVTEVTESGSNKFVLKLASGDPLHFEAPAAERDSWVHTLKSKIAEAKAAADDITESDGYKAALEKLSTSSASFFGRRGGKS